MTHAEKLVKTVVESFGQSDLRPLLAALHEDVVWKSAATVRDDQFPYGGQFQGRANVVEHTALLAKSFSFQAHTVREMISKRDVVWALTDAALSHGPQAKDGLNPIVLEAALRFRIRGGKIHEIQVFFDTARLLAEQHAP